MMRGTVLPLIQTRRCIMPPYPYRCTPRAFREEPKTGHKRPARDTVITKDDVMDLRIALGSTKSVDDFLAMI